MCVTTGQSLYHRLANGVDKGNQSDIVFLDFSNLLTLFLRSFSEGKLKLNKPRTEMFKQTYYNRISYLWNNLPKDLRLFNFSPFNFT